MGEDVRDHSLRTRLGSLPPHVEGKVNGYLSMTVDTKWRSELHGEVHVLVSWWGEKHKILFIPQVMDVSGKCHVSLKNTYVYRIMTNTELFLSYLQDGEELNFEVYEQGTDCLMGTATLKHLMSIVLNNPLTESCVVIDKNGAEIADLSVSFVFHQNVSTSRESVIKNKAVTSFQRILGSEMEETLESSGKSRNCKKGETYIDQCSSSLPRTKVESMEMEAGMNLDESTDVVSNSTISELLEQCHNIRQEYQNNERNTLQLSKKSVERSLASTEPKIQDYFLGKKMNRVEELAALETVRFRIPVQELLQLAESCSQSSEENEKNGNSSHVKKPQNQPNTTSQESFIKSESGDFNAFEKQIKDSQNKEKKNEAGKFSNATFFSSKQNRNMRFLRLTMQTLSLNYVGMQRVLVLSRALSYSTHLHNTASGQQLPTGIVYFVEYEIPQYLRVHSTNSQKTKRPWNCNVYRICSRQKSGKSIHFHRQMIHMLASQKPRFRELLYSSFITFKVYSRHMNQRLPSLIGKASMSLGTVIKKFALSADQELSIHPQSEGNPSCLLSLGILKLKVEFGSSRTCFDQKTASVPVSQSLPSSSETEYEYGNLGTCTFRMSSKSSNLSSKKQTKCDKMIYEADTKRKNNCKEHFLKPKPETDNDIARKCCDKKEILLFGLLHVSSGQDFKSSSLYLVTHGFWKEDVMTSDICWQTNNPNFKFHKIMPVLLSLELLDRCYNNFIVVEVWSQNSLVGIAKLPLNQFYIAFRDPQVVEQLLTSKYPIISVDGWVDVVEPATLDHVGKLNVVLAMGTENQIQMLEMSRCMKEDIINTQMVSQSFTADLNHIISRSATPANSSLEKETVLKVRYGECSQNERDLQDYDKHSTGRYEQEIKRIKSRESLFASGDYSDDFLQKLICEDKGREEHFSERKSSSVQSKDSHVLRTGSFPSFSGSADDNGMTQREFPEASLLQEIRPASISAQSNLNSVELSEGNCLVTTDFSASQKSNHVSHLHINYLQKLDSDAKGKICSSSEENLLQNLKSVDNDVEESNNSLCNEEIQILKKKRDKTSSNSTTDVRNLGEQSLSNKICGSTLCHVSEEHSFIEESLNIPENISSEKCKEVESLPDDTQIKCMEDRLCEDLYRKLSITGVNNIFKNNIDFRNAETSDLLNYQLGRSNDCFSIAAVTENASTQTDILCEERFFAMIEIINALYIAKLDNGKLPNCYVTLHTANNSVMSTSVISENTDPVWNWSSEVWLPAVLLGNNGRCLILKVWHKKDDNSDHPNVHEDLVLGFVALDLQVLVCGLPSISGWFNICDISGSCKGQIQICVTPLETVSSLLNKTYCQESKGKENNDFIEATVTCFLHSSSGKHPDNIYQKPEFVEENTESSSVSLDMKAIILSSEPKKEIYQSSYKDRNVERNETSETYYNPRLKIHSISSKFGEVSNVCANQMHYKNLGNINKPQKQIHNVSSNPENSTSNDTNQSFSEYFNSSDEACSSSLSETLRQKLQELDNILQQMKSKSELHTKIVPRKIYSEKKLKNKSTDQEYYCEPTHCYKALSANISQGAKSHGNDFLAHNYNKFSALKERESKSKHSESNTSCSFPLQETESVFYNSSSSVSIPTKCISTTIDEGESKIKEKKISVDKVSDSVVTDLMTDHLMYESLHELELENIFNPLLFQHILANHQLQRCCSQWFGKINKSSFSSHEEDCTSLLSSKRNKGHFWKTQNFMKILTGIFDNTGDDVYDCVHDRENSIGNDLLPNFPDQVSVDANQSDNERVTCLANASSSEPYAKADCEYLPFSKHSDMQTIGKNLNSLQTKYSRNTNSKERDCSKSIEFLNDTKHYCHTSSEFECASLRSDINCKDHKVLNTPFLSGDVKDEELENCTFEFKNALASIKHPVNTSPSSSEKSFAFDISSEGIEVDVISKRSDKTQHNRKMNSNENCEQVKV